MQHRGPLVKFSARSNLDSYPTTRRHAGPQARKVRADSGFQIHRARDMTLVGFPSFAKFAGYVPSKNAHR